MAAEPFDSDANHRRPSLSGQGQKSVEVSIEGSDNTVFIPGRSQNLVIRSRSKSTLTSMDHIVPCLAKQLGG